jgi:HTH-type transcriptional regulator/antitoxin HipB
MVQLARTPKQIGVAIARERRRRGLNQAALASLVGLRQEAISKIEAGNDATRLSKILDILAALDLELTVAPRRKGTAQDIEDIF